MICELRGKFFAHLVGMTTIRLPSCQSSATASRARCGCALLRANFLHHARGNTVSYY